MSIFIIMKLVVCSALSYAQGKIGREPQRSVPSGPVDYETIKRMEDVQVKELGDRESFLRLEKEGFRCYHYGDFYGAIRWWQEELEQSQSTHNLRVVQGSLVNLGMAYQQLGEYGRALIYYRRALNMKNIETDGGNRAEMLLGMGSVYDDLGDTGKAKVCWLQAWEIYHNVADARAFAPLNNIGWMFVERREFAKAVDYFHRAMAEIKNPRSSEADSIRANLMFIRIERCVEEGKFKEALALGRGWSPVVSGRWCLLTGRYREAERLFSKDLAIARHFKIRSRVISNLVGLGLCREFMGRLTDAKNAYRQAIQQYEEDREAIPFPERPLFLSGGDLQFSRIEPYEGLVRVAYREGAWEKAFFWSEHTKARTSTEAMAHTPQETNQGIPSELRTKEQELIKRIAGTREQTIKAIAERNDALYARLETDRRQISNQLQQLISQLRQTNPEYASMHYPQPLKASELALRSDEVLVEFEVTETETLVFVVRDRKVVFAYPVKLTRKELIQKVNDFRKGMQNIATDLQLVQQGRKDIKDVRWKGFGVLLAHSLYHDLLERALKKIKPDEKVLIVPDEVLCLLPMEALVTQMPAGEVKWEDRGKGLYPKGVQYVGDDQVLTYWQSASALTVTRNLRKQGPSNRRILVVADPIYNRQDTRKSRWKPLGHMVATRGAETEALRRMLTDEQTAVVGHLGWLEFDRLIDTGLDDPKGFARVLLERYGRDATVLAGEYACESRLLVEPLEEYGLAVLYATHGIVDERTPYLHQAALVLSNPSIIGEPSKITVGENGSVREINGYLTMSKVMDQRLRVELAGALACSTGEGDIIAGEGVMNLGRAFQYAGARSVLVSLWAVTGTSTNLLTEQLLEAISEGQSKDEAFLMARKHIRATGYAHPFYWSSFVLIGERDMKIVSVPSTMRSHYPLIIAGVLGGLIIMWVIRRYVTR